VTCSAPKTTRVFSRSDPRLDRPIDRQADGRTAQASDLSCVTTATSTKTGTSKAGLEGSMIETEKSAALFNLAKTALSGTRNGAANGPASTSTIAKTDGVDEVARLLETSKDGPLARAASGDGIRRAASGGGAVPPPPLLARASEFWHAPPKKRRSEKFCPPSTALPAMSARPDGRATTPFFVLSSSSSSSSSSASSTVSSRRVGAPTTRTLNS